MNKDGLRTRALIILSLTSAVVPYDYIGVNLATPRIRSELGFTSVELPWILGIYVLVFGGFLVLGGRLGDLYGRKRMLLTGLGIFAVCSVLTTLATSPAVFLAARAVKGLGSALLSPNALAATIVLFPEGKERNRSFGRSSLIMVIFGVIYTVGAGIVLAHGWRPLLFANVPIVLILGWLIGRYVPESRGLKATSRFDFGGAALSVLSFGTLSFSVSSAFRLGVSSPLFLGVFAASMVLFAALIRVERQHSQPMIPLHLLKIRNVVGAYLVCFLWSASNTNYPLNLFFQDLLKYTPQQASLAMLPNVLSGTLISLCAAAILGALGLRWALFAALAVEIVGVGIYTTFIPQSVYWTHILPGSLITNGSFMFIWIAVRLIATAGVPNEDQGIASGGIFAMQQLGNSFGIPLLASVLNAATLSHGGAQNLAARTFGFHWMFGTSVILVAAALLGGLLVIRRIESAPEPVLPPAEFKPEAVGDLVGQN